MLCGQFVGQKVSLQVHKFTCQNYFFRLSFNPNFRYNEKKNRERLQKLELIVQFRIRHDR